MTKNWSRSVPSLDAPGIAQPVKFSLAAVS